MQKTKIQKIQVIGERCSGTNYLQHLLQKNLKAVRLTWDHGFKHYCYPAPKVSDEYLFVVIWRNPFDWLRSLHLKPWHAATHLRGVDFSEFIRKEWYSVWDEATGIRPQDPKFGQEMMRDRNPITGARFSNCIEMRNIKNNIWHRLNEVAELYMHIKYEDLKQDPKVFINQISDTFQIRKRIIFRNVRGYGGSRKKYKPKKYNLIKENDLEYIYSQLNLDLETSIGYLL